MTRPTPADDATRQRLKRQARRDTAPELLLRRELWRRELRYRVDHRVIGRRRRVDIAFTRARVAVFVDGCFWHSCPVHATRPKNNGEWWATKLEANVARDRATDLELRQAGWAVVRVWEHENPEDAADRVEQVLRERMSQH